MSIRTPPPSTITELREVLISYDASRPRSMQTALGPSELGSACQQQIARKIVGAPRRPITEPAWAPFQGTAVHAEMEHVLQYWNAQAGRERWIIEDDLAMDDEIRGHGDAYDTFIGCVVDWKHSGKTQIAKLLAAQRAGKPPKEQVKQEYRIQAHLYGLGHARKGRDVKLVRLVFLARDWQYASSAEWTEEYNENIAFWALDRMYSLKDTLLTLDVANQHESITRIPATPGEACSFCPFHRAGRPSDWDGCAGDEARTTRARDRFTSGILTT